MQEFGHLIDQTMRLFSYPFYIFGYALTFKAILLYFSVAGFLIYLLFGMFD